MADPIASTGSSKISFIIINFRTDASVARCIESIAQESRSILCDISVVSNSSPSTTLRETAKEYRAQLIEMPENLGYAAACNAGIRASDGKYAFILNPDCELRDSNLRELLAYADASPDAGIIGPALVREAGRWHGNGWRRPTVWRIAMDYLHLAGRKESGCEAANAAEPRDVDWLSGSALLIRRVCVAALHGFDERLFLYAEDTDLCLRASLNGWRVVLFPGSTIIHRSGEATVGAADRARVFYGRFSRLYLFKKHYRCGSRVMLRLVTVAEVTPKLLYRMAAWPLGRNRREHLDYIVAYVEILKGLIRTGRRLDWRSLSEQTRRRIHPSG